MPDLATILLFVSASVALLVVPGPTTALVVARSIAEGRRIALPLVLGVGLGDFLAATFALAGAGTLLAASATAFTVVKLVGAAYLVWLGVRLFRADPVLPCAAGDVSAATGHAVFRDGFFVTVFNPKAILFFVAFVPQFISPDGSYLGQAAFFVIAFTVLSILNGAIYAMGADVLRRVIRRTAVLKWMNRAGGAVIALAGVTALFTRRPVL